VVRKRGACTLERGCAEETAASEALARAQALEVGGELDDGGGGQGAEVVGEEALQEGVGEGGGGFVDVGAEARGEEGDGFEESICFGIAFAGGEGATELGEAIELGGVVGGDGIGHEGV
jgi:hypothetical protein